MYIISTVARAWWAWRAKNRTRQELRGLDDHLLRDIGIRRDEIDELVQRNHSSTYGAGRY